MLDAAETQARLARLAPAEANALPEVDDLDWVLFHSFPDCEVAPADFAATLPHFERALRAGVGFDYELLFVRTLEVGETIGAGPREDLARAAIDCTLANAFEPAEAMAAIRFVARVLPENDAFFAKLFAEESLAERAFCFISDQMDFPPRVRELDSINRSTFSRAQSVMSSKSKPRARASLENPATQSAMMLLRVSSTPVRQVTNSG